MEKENRTWLPTVKEVLREALIVLLGAMVALLVISLIPPLRRFFMLAVSGS